MHPWLRIQTTDCREVTFGGLAENPCPNMGRSGSNQNSHIRSVNLLLSKEGHRKDENWRDGNGPQTQQRHPESGQKSQDG